MFPQFGATAESLSKASSLVLRIGTDAHLYDDPDDANIATLLDSKFDPEKAEALKRLLALTSQGADVAGFFPQVVKNVASQSLEVKKLVYLYLLHYAQKRPNEALLSINCFQKDLSDTNPLVRAWALRAMAGIRLHVVAPLVLVAINKCARDPSAYVRKCAANALPKLYDLHLEENASVLGELVSFLLGDQSPGVVGAAAAAFNSVCPNNISLIGRNFRRLCETLPDVEEWGQIILIEILLRYVVAKHGLVKESIMLTSTSSASFVSDKDSSAACQMSDNHHGFMGGGTGGSKLNALMFRYYIDGQEECLTQTDNAIDEDGNLERLVSTSFKNSDVEILLRCTSPLLWSQNSAVVLAAAGVHWVLAPREEVHRIVKPLLFILRSSRPSEYVMLCNIQVFVKVVPSLFAHYYEDFFVRSTDSYQIKALKLEILSAIATDSSIPIVFEEFQDYIKDPDRRFVADTVAAIGLCAQRLPSIARICLRGLLALILQESSISSWDHEDGEAGVLVQALMSIKEIIKQNPVDHEKIIAQLARNLDTIKEPAARALIVWIVGEYSSVGQVIPQIIPTVLKYLAWSFTSEEAEAKLQILNTCAKVVMHAQSEEVEVFRKILSYILELAKYDLNYDVRDRARIIETFTPCNIALGMQTTESVHYKLIENILRGKTLSTSHPEKSFRFYLPGSLSQIVLHAAPGYVPLPKPCSLPENDMNILSEMAHEGSAISEKMSNGDSYEMKDLDTYSGSSDEESNSNYDSQPSVTSSTESEGAGISGDLIGNGRAALFSNNDTGKDREIPLVYLSDAGVGCSQTVSHAEGNISSSFSTDLAELMSKSALESWLNEQPGLSSVQKSEKVTSARISINDLGFTVKPKVQKLLDPTNGSGLSVEYAFSTEISSLSPLLVCVELFFGNHSTEPLTNISVKDVESDGMVESADQVVENPESLPAAEDVPTLLPIEEIACLEPGQTMKKVLQVYFRHHLLPLKLAVFCNGKKHLTKLWPDIGYFLRPLPMTMEAFLDKESQLPGMFEYAKRTTFTDHIEELGHESQHSSHGDKILAVSRSLALKLLNNANVYVVSVDMPVSSNIDDASGLCMRFSGKISSSLNPCLITITAEGKCSEPLDISVQVNCEETIFGLNLLNRVAAFLH